MDQKGKKTVTYSPPTIASKLSYERTPFLEKRYFVATKETYLTNLQGDTPSMIAQRIQKVGIKYYPSQFMVLMGVLLMSLIFLGILVTFCLH